MGRRYLRCYARGRKNTWEAVCIDLDLAVQGRTFAEVKALLESTIQSYAEDAMKEEPAVARRLLNRRAPFFVRAKFGLEMLLYSISARSRDDSNHPTNFEVPCPA